MEDLKSILISLVLIVSLIFVVCLGWGIPFSFGKAVSIWAGIMLGRCAKTLIFD